MKQLTKDFTLEELIHSNTAIENKLDNTPSEKVELCLSSLAKNILQPLRDGVSIPISINCGYRSKLVNSKVGGAKDSQHLLGQAADIRCAEMRKAFLFIQNNLPFDQLIWENGNDCKPDWIHVSYSDRNRRQVLRKKTGSKNYSLFKIEK